MTHRTDFTHLRPRSRAPSRARATAHAFSCRAARRLSLALLLAASLTGCAQNRPASPYAGQSAEARDSSRAEALNQEAADLIEKDAPRAERLLREALAADLYHGAAHNNLGTILLGQGRLYDAAAEFEWARKLLPGHPDPRHNLALTFELAGRYDDALATYAAALDVYPEHLPTIQAMARLQLRAAKTDDRTAQLLDTIALRGQTQEWRQWARTQMSKGTVLTR